MSETKEIISQSHNNRPLAQYIFPEIRRKETKVKVEPAEALVTDLAFLGFRLQTTASLVLKGIKTGAYLAKMSNVSHMK